MNRESRVVPQMHRRQIHLPQSLIQNPVAPLLPKVIQLLLRSQLTRHPVHNLHTDQQRLPHHQSRKAQAPPLSLKCRCQGWCHQMRRSLLLSYPNGLFHFKLRP